MRIITGIARGAKLEAPAGLHTRPTAERTKEAVFSMLGGRFATGVALDLFAGSGQLGLEAVSRGAKEAVLVDASPRAVNIIKKNVAKTHFEAECQVVCARHTDFLQRGTRERFDLVVLDPPYAERLIPDTLRALIKGAFLSEGAIVVCESAQEDVFGGDDATAACFAVRKATKYGVAYVTILA